MSNSVIQVDDLHQWVELGQGSQMQRIDILNGIDLSVQAGESLAITGVSGSGKSTLLGMLAGLDLPRQGRVTLFGQDLSQMDEDGRASVRANDVGFVFQSFHLMAHLSALENVMLPLELNQHQQVVHRAEAALQAVGLGHRSDVLASRLSGGEQQRVAIARAIVTQPKLLLADEPTGNLDKKTGDKIVRLLFDLQAEHHITMILLTHDESLAAKCQRHVRLLDGRLMEHIAGS